MFNQARRTAFIVAFIGIGFLTDSLCRPAHAKPWWRPQETMHVILYGGTNDLLLLTEAYEPVRKQLKLTAEQQAEFDKISAEIRAFDEQLAAIGEEPAGDDFESHLREFRSRMSKRLADVLTTDQWERLGELSFRGKAPGIPLGTIIDKALQLTRDQLKQRSDLQQNAEIQADILNRAVRNGELADNSQTARQIGVDCERMMLEVLTPDQRAKLDKMKGDSR